MRLIRLEMGKKDLLQKTHLLLFTICCLYLLLKWIIFLNGNVFFDEGIYVGISKYFLSAGDAGFFETIRPLALPLLLVPGQMFSNGAHLDLNSLILGRILSLILSIGCLLLIYWSAAQLFDKKAGLWAAFLATTSITLLTFSGYILNDLIAFTLVLVASVFFLKGKLLKQNYFWSGMLVGGSFLFKFPTLLVLIPFAGY